MAEVVSDIEGFSKMVENRDFYLLLKSPIIKVGKKAEILNLLLEGKVNKLTKAFLDITLRKGREGYLPEIANEFLNQYKRMQGISSVKLVTATPISESTIEAIKAKLLASEVTDKSVEIESSVDESLIGGFIVQIGDKQIDASVAHKLAELAKTMTSKEYIKEL